MSIEPLIIKTYKAAIQLRRVSDKQVKAALIKLSNILEQNRDSLLKANAKDLAKQVKDNPRNDRLMLNEERIKTIAKSIRTISKLSNPSGKILENRTLNNGLSLEKITVPLGVV